MNYQNEVFSHSGYNAPYDVGLWIYTPHSDPRINLVDVTKDLSLRQEITTLLFQLYGYTLRADAHIWYVSEVCGTLNFKVFIEERDVPLLLRIHKRITDEARIKLLHRVQCYVYDRGVFSDGLGRCLVPIETRATDQNYGIFNGLYVSLSEFASNVTHYGGHSIEEVINFASKYGALQQCLQNASFDVPVLGRPSLESWSRLDRSFFELISSSAKRLSAIGAENYARVFVDNYDYLLAVFDELQDIKVTRNAKPLLHDLHPHDTFFSGDKCVLIYDYEDVASGLDESTTLAFSLHRFVRELFVHRRDRLPAEIERAVDLFLEHYQKSGMPIATGFKGSLHLHIKLINLMKLLNVMAYFFGISRDPAARSESFWYSEITKFISYLYEASQFRFKPN